MPLSEQQDFAPFLLHGVTASGKTEVYLQAAQEALDLGKGILVLLPEIALTDPVGQAFRQRFGPRVALLHSGLSLSARLDQWRRLAQGEMDIVVGARSAVFAPVPNLGLIVVDEEHDPAYKNEGGLPYQARDAALYRGQLARATVVLGSATPAVTTFYRAQEGKYHYLNLPQRVTPQTLPQIHLINLQEHREHRRLPIIATPLRLALAETLARGEQALLFLNRRGYANVYFCLFCGHICQCRSCSVTLTLHRQEERLRCHYCGYQEPVPAVCPECQSSGLEALRLGHRTPGKRGAAAFPCSQGGPAGPGYRLPERQSSGDFRRFERTAPGHPHRHPDDHQRARFSSGHPGGGGGRGPEPLFSGVSCRRAHLSAPDPGGWPGRTGRQPRGRSSFKPFTRSTQP